MGGRKNAPALHRKLPCFKNGFASVRHLSLVGKYGLMESRKVTLSLDDLQSNDKTIENCVLADLFGASLILSTCQRTLEQSAFTMIDMYRSQGTRFKSEI